MEIKIRYENGYKTFEIEFVELEKWLNISISEGESLEDYKKRIQDVIDERFNKPEYNNWHKHNRHIGNAYMQRKDGTVEVNTEEAIMVNAIDPSIFTRDIDEQLERENREWQYDRCCNYLRSILKPDAAEMVVAIVLDEMTVGEYAALIGENANNVSHRYRRAINILKKNNFSKTSF